MPPNPYEPPRTDSRPDEDAAKYPVRKDDVVFFVFFGFVVLLGLAVAVWVVFTAISAFGSEKLALNWATMALST